jgi:hypothetical protein
MPDLRSSFGIGFVGVAVVLPPHLSGAAVQLPHQRFFGYVEVNRALHALAILFCCVGCSQSGPQRASVSGSVLLDGQPVVKGSMNFVPVEGTVGPTAGANIENGRYSIDREKGVTVGKNRVKISSVQPTGKKIMAFGELTDEWAEVVPAEYNARSTLVRPIQPGSNLLDFDLKRKL